MKVVDMKMNQVKVLCVAEDFLHHQDVVCQRINAIRIQSQSLLAGRHQARITDGIATGK